MKTYRELEIWNVGMQIAALAYQLTKLYPKEELFGMTSQLRRSAASIPANIAEGWGRNNNNEFRYFLKIANGSLKELETHLLLSEMTGLCKAEQVKEILELCTQEGKMILSFIRSISAKK